MMAETSCSFRPGLIICKAAMCEAMEALVAWRISSISPWSFTTAQLGEQRLDVVGGRAQREGVGAVQPLQGVGGGRHLAFGRIVDVNRRAAGREYAGEFGGHLVEAGYAVEAGDRCILGLSAPSFGPVHFSWVTLWAGRNRISL